MRKGILIIFSLVLSLEAYSQRSYSASQEAFFGYMDFINECTLALNESSACLEELYGEVVKVKTGKSNQLPKDFFCVPQASDKKLLAATKKSRNIQSARTHDINLQGNELWMKYVEILDLYRELTTYVRKGSYVTDRFERFDQMIPTMLQAYGEFSSIQANLTNEILNVHRILQPSLANAYAKASKQMVGYLGKEKTFLAELSYDLDKQSTQEGILDDLDKNINSQSISIGTFTYGSYLGKSAAEPYKDFVRTARELNQLKKELRQDIGSNPQKFVISAGHYKQLINTYNTFLLGKYNNFVKACAEDDFNFIPNSALVMSVRANPGQYNPVFVKQKITYQATPTPKKEAPSIERPKQNTPGPKVKKQGTDDTASAPKRKKKSERKMNESPLASTDNTPVPSYVPTSSSGDGLVGSLNDQVNFLNQIVYSTRMLQHSLESYTFFEKYFTGIDFNTYKGSGNIDYEYGKGVIPTKAYLRATQSVKRLPGSERKMVDAYLKELHDIMYELEDLDDDLKKYVSSQEYKVDNLERSHKIIKRFKDLLEQLQLRKTEASQYIHRIYDAKTSNSPQNSWIRSAKELSALINEAHKELEVLKQQFKGKTKTRPDADRLQQMANALLDGQNALMQGIEKGYGDDNPYHPFNSIIESAYSLSTEMDLLNKNIKNDHRAYAKFVYHYNEMVSEYNLFVELAPRSLLNQTLELYLISLETPEVQVVAKEVVPDETDPTTMEGFAANNMVLLLDVSASMSGRARIGLLKESFGKLIPILRSEDEVAVVVYSGNARVVLKPTSLDNKKEVEEVIRSLRSSGKSNADAGIKLAYETARKNFITGGNNRIIMATDGDILLSNASLKLAEEYAQQGIFMSIFNFGKEKKLDRLERLASNAKGIYSFVNRENSDLIMLKEAKARRIQ